MRIKKDSLLRKIIDYNTMAIIITSVAIALFLIVIAFKNIDDNIEGIAKEKIFLINRAYTNIINENKDVIFSATREMVAPAIDDRDSAVAKEIYRDIANKMRERLINIDSQKYKSVLITIVSENGNFLGEVGDSDTDENISSNIIERNRGMLASKIIRVQRDLLNSYLVKANGIIYVRIFYPLVRIESSVRKYALITLPLTAIIDQEFFDFLHLNKSDKIFVDAGNGIQDPNFKIKKSKKISTQVFIREKNLVGYNDIQKIKFENGGSYYLTNYKLYNYAYENIGNIVIAIDNSSHSSRKVMIGLITGLIVCGMIIISNIVCRKFFYDLLKPLSKVVVAADKVANGSYEIDLMKYGVEELNNLTGSFEKMVNVIKNNEEDLKIKNEKLQKNMHNIDTIVKLLMGIDNSEEVNSIVAELLRAITSEMGLGYSRAMYFRYSREIDTLVGELSEVNSVLKKTLTSNSSKIKGFKFQIEEFDKLIKLIKIPYKDDNLLKRSIKERKVIFYNDKGYKYDFGNDLFQSLGITNFIIFPIFTASRNYGCIIADNFAKGKIITQEEVELITLLFINISMKITNKDLEEEKIDKERILTVEKLSEKFINRREVAIDKLLSMVEKIEETNTKNAALKNGVAELKSELLSLNKEVETLKEYSTESKEKFVPFSLEIPIKNAAKKLYDDLSNDGIILSVFVDHDDMIIGDAKRIERVFIELLRNAQDALNSNDNTNKKINIVVTKDKHIEKLKILIKDNGIGMTEEQMKNIYDPFVSYSNSPGLGLSIVSRIVKNHSGVIKIKSEVGKGTEVKITLNLFKEEIL